MIYLTYIHTYTPTYTHIYTHPHTYTHIHKYTHTRAAFYDKIKFSVVFDQKYNSELKLAFYDEFVKSIDNRHHYVLSGILYKSETGRLNELA